MPFAYSKLHGLPAERLLAAIDPILAAHGLEGVELIWKTDNRGWVLYVTVERASTAFDAGTGTSFVGDSDAGDSAESGAGVTLDDCSELSRDLSAALDVDDLIPGAYRLEVGTPGIERRLYSVADFQRFTSKLAKFKLHKPQAGEYTFRGYIVGVEVTDAGPALVLVAKERATAPENQWRFEFDNINTAYLVLEWGGDTRPKGHPKASKNAKPNTSANADAGVEGASPKNMKLRASRPADGTRVPVAPHYDHSDESRADEVGQDKEFDSAAAVATTQVKHGS